MNYIFPGNLKVKLNNWFEKQEPNYSNGSAMTVKKLTSKQFQKESIKLKKFLKNKK